MNSSLAATRTTVAQPRAKVEGGMHRRGLGEFFQKHAPYIFVAPFLLSFLVFGAYPILRSLVLSLYITSGPEAQQFVGLDNYTY